MIEEGRIKKGGWNEKPTSKRPEPPKGQGIALCCSRITQAVKMPHAKILIIGEVKQL